MKINRPPKAQVTPPESKVSARTSAPAAAPTAAPAKGWGAKTAAAAPKATSKGWVGKAPALGPAPVAVRASVATSVPVAAPSRFRDPAFTAQLDADTRSRATPGNGVTMLFDGVTSFAERGRMIAGAQKSISLQTFIFNSDETGWALANQLAAKAKEGVQVRVIYDGLGSNRADPKMFEMMKAAGVDVREYGPQYDLPDLNNRWHEKHLIVDGQASIEGGMNIANEYALGGSGKMVFSRGTEATEPWRDADVKIAGPAVNDAARSFLSNWKTLGGEVSAPDEAAMLAPQAQAAGGTTVRVVQSNPGVEGAQNATHRLYLDAINHAQTSITIENAYFLPPDDLRQALTAAAQRGVQVKVLTNSRETNDMGAVSDAARYFYDDLEKAGVKIYEKQGGTLHSKTACFDGEFSIVGSVNLNGRSTNLDTEDALAIDGPAAGQQLEARFTQGLTQAREVTLDELGHEDFVTNLKQWALSTLAWTF